MGTREKLIEHFKSQPADFTFDEMERLLAVYGYSRGNKGRTSVSRVEFVCNGKPPIILHRPHPAKIIRGYAMKQVLADRKWNYKIKSL